MTITHVSRSDHETEVRRLRNEIAVLERKLEYADGRLTRIESEFGHELDTMRRKRNLDEMTWDFGCIVLAVVVVFVIAVRLVT